MHFQAPSVRSARIFRPRVDGSAVASKPEGWQHLSAGAPGVGQGLLWGLVRFSRIRCSTELDRASVGFVAFLQDSPHRGPRWGRWGVRWGVLLRWHARNSSRRPMTLISSKSSAGTWCSGITSASHAEGPGFKSQCVHFARACGFVRTPVMLLGIIDYLA